ncbi:MAG TPA: hypothetical protein VLA72_13250 [Anaerolineales bacterium]|nr:hypothetical protein [Anaerolineales bacterium]
MLNTDGDLPRHLVTGKYILETGQLPQTEPFVYPYQNQEFVSQQWLSGVVFYLIYKYTGLSGIVVFSALLLAGAFLLLYNDLAKRLDLRFSIFLVVMLGAATTSLSWITRPHLISMFFLAVWLVWADRLRRGENMSIWYFPVLMLIWTNFHGEFISGMLVLLAYAAGSFIDNLMHKDGKSEIKKIWFALILSGLITIINPGGLKRWAGMLGFMNNQYMMTRMLEANPPNFQDPEMNVLLGLIALSIFLLAYNKNRMSASQGLLLAGFTAMSLMAFRNIHLYGVVAPFVLSETLSSTIEIPFIKRFEQNLKVIETNIQKGFVLPLAVVIALSVFISTSKAGSKIYNFNSEFFPVNAVNWVKEHPPKGNMFNDLNWGGYIALNLWPDQLTFVDSVADIDGQLTMQYEKVVTLQSGWENIFEEYDIQWAIIPSQSKLSDELVKQGWNTQYVDKTTIVLQAQTK